MRSLPTRDARNYGFSEGPSSLRVLLLYEDATTALRSKQLVDHIVEHVNLVISFRLTLCRFDLLNVLSSSQLDAEDPLNCDIVVLSAHGQDDLPSTVRAWLDLWLTRNPGQPRALVISLDEQTRNSMIANQIQCFLQASACQSGVEVFAHFGKTHYSELDSAIAGIRYRAETTSVILGEALQRSGSQTLRP